MHRPLLTFAVLIVTLAHPAPVAAGFWAWLEEWSGPGPFKGPPTLLLTACVQDRTLKPSPIARDDTFHHEMVERARMLADAGITLPLAERLKRVMANPTLWDTAGARQTAPEGEPRTPPKDALPRLKAWYEDGASKVGPGHIEKALGCVYLDQGFFRADPDPVRGFPQLRAHMTDIGPSARLHDGVDVGGGVGWVTFTGEGIEKKRQVALTPVRLVLRPVLLAVPEHHRKAWMGFLNIYWKETYVAGRLTGADFGAPTNAFSVDGELIRSFGLNLDVTALFPSKWRASTN